MAIRQRKRANVEDLPVSSFSDIAFLLIIFFILVTSFEKFAGFQASLPAGDKSTETQSEKMPTIKLHDGVINLDETRLSVDELRGKLAKMNLAALPEDKRIVLLEASGKIAYQQYYEVMAAIQSSGGVVGIIEEGE